MPAQPRFLCWLVAFGQTLEAAELVFSSLRVILHESTSQVSVSPRDWECIHHTFQKRQDRLPPGRNGRYQQHSLQRRSLRTKPISGWVQHTLVIDERRGQIGPRGKRGAGVVSSKVNWVVWYQIAQNQRNESCRACPRSGDQCGTLAHWRLYRLF